MVTQPVYNNSILLHYIIQNKKINYHVGQAGGSLLMYQSGSTMSLVVVPDIFLAVIWLDVFVYSTK